MDSWWASFPGADSAPNPYDTSAVPPEFQTRPEAPQVLLDIGTATDGLNTTTNVLEKRILGIFEAVICPATISLLFHKVRRLHQLQVPARVRLRDLERLDEFAHAKTVLGREQAAGKPQPKTVTKGVEKVFALREL